MIRTLRPCSISLAANATERSSSPSTDQALALLSTLMSAVAASQGDNPSLISSLTVTAGNPYIIVRFQAVVSYIIDDPFLRVFCRSSIRTDFLSSASNSIIAAMSGASGCRFGIIKLPGGIVKSFFISPDWSRALPILISLLFVKSSTSCACKRSTRVNILPSLLLASTT